MPQFALSQPAALGRWQAGLVIRSAIAGATALLALALIGAQSEITLTVVPAFASVAVLTVDEYNLHRLASGRAAMGHRWCAAILGSTVLVVASVVFSAT